MSSRRIYWLFGFWLAISIICNDVANIGNIKLGVNIRLDRIVYITLILASLTCLSRDGRLMPWNMEEKLMSAFFFICLVSCILGGSIENPRNRYISNLFNFAFIPATLFAISRRLEFNHELVQPLMRFFQVIAVYLSLTGIFEHYQIKSLIFPSYILDSSVGYHFGRSRGPFVQAVVMGAAVNLLFLWILWYHRFIQKSWLNVAILPACMATAYFTDTRSVWLQFAASTAILAVLSKRLRKAAFSIVFLLVIVYFSGVASKFSPYQKTLFSRRDEQVDDRINIAYASLRMFLVRPVFGFGYGQFASQSDPYFKEIDGVQLRGQGEGQHHTILGLLADLGLVGTFPYLAIFFLLALSCHRVLRHDGIPAAQREMAVTQLAALGGVAVLMQFGDIRDFNFVNDVVFWLAGKTYAIREGGGLNEKSQPDAEIESESSLEGLECGVTPEG